MSEHTNDKWELRREYLAGEKEVAYYWIAGKPLDDCGTVETIVDRIEGISEARARHIVKCVNHFEEMREALKALENFILFNHDVLPNNAIGVLEELHSTLARIEAGE